MNQPEGQAGLRAAPQFPVGLRIVEGQASEALPECGCPGAINPRRATRVRPSSEKGRVKQSNDKLRVRHERSRLRVRLSYDYPKVRIPSHAPLSGFYDSQGPGECERPRDQPAARVGRTQRGAIIIWEPGDAGSNRVSAMMGSIRLNRTPQARGLSLASGRSTGPPTLQASSRAVTLRTRCTRLFSSMLVAPSTATSGSDTGRRAMSGR